MTAPFTLTTFFVAGLDCPAEEQLIRKQLQTIPEIKQLYFNFIAEEVTVHHCLRTIDPIQKKIESLGMSVRSKSSNVSDQKGKRFGIDASWGAIGIDRKSTRLNSSH